MAFKNCVNWEKIENATKEHKLWYKKFHSNQKFLKIILLLSDTLLIGRELHTILFKVQNYHICLLNHSQKVQIIGQVISP